jgi:hypothetical protein
MSQHDFPPESAETYISSLNRKNAPIIVGQLPREQLRCRRMWRGIGMAFLANGLVMNVGQLGPAAEVAGLVVGLILIVIVDYFERLQVRNGYFLRVYRDRIEYGNGWDTGAVEIEAIDQIIEKDKILLAILKSGAALRLPRGREFNDAYRALSSRIPVRFTIPA